MQLSDLGWNSFLQQLFRPFAAQGLDAARVVRADRNLSRIVDETGTHRAELTGRLRHESPGRAERPVVGDWVAVAPADDDSPHMIHAVLPRQSAFSRRSTVAKQSDLVEEQVLCANVDTVFLIVALDDGRSTNPQQIERYLALANDSGADPILVLNKADLCPEPDIAMDAISRLAPAVPVYAVSALSGVGMGDLLTHAGRGRTLALLGPSGVGKSSIINSLIGDACLPIGEVRESDRRGRHTTTCGEMVFLPEGGILIDTPGLRTVRLWLDDESLQQTYGDIDALAEECRFRDCTHTHEPGCAVCAAVQSGELDQGRYERFLVLRDEAHLTNRDRQQRKEKRGKEIAQALRQMRKLGVQREA
jgi:ribosome biogenesis GTPase / thiamine phosphate phosphatase